MKKVNKVIQTVYKVTDGGPIQEVDFIGHYKYFFFCGKRAKFVETKNMNTRLILFNMVKNGLKLDIITNIAKR